MLTKAIVSVPTAFFPLFISHNGDPSGSKCLSPRCYSNAGRKSWPNVTFDLSADPPSPLLKQILNFYKLPDFPTVSPRALCPAPAIFFLRPRGQLIVIAQLLKICPLGFTEVKGLTPGSPPVFMSLPTKGFVMNREPQETKAFSKDKQLCSIHQHLRSLPPALVKTHFLTEIIWGWGRSQTHKGN